MKNNAQLCKFERIFWTDTTFLCVMKIYFFSDYQPILACERKRRLLDRVGMKNAIFNVEALLIH